MALLSSPEPIPQWADTCNGYIYVVTATGTPLAGVPGRFDRDPQVEPEGRAIQTNTWQITCKAPDKWAGSLGRNDGQADGSQVELDVGAPFWSKSCRRLFPMPWLLFIDGPRSACLNGSIIEPGANAGESTVPVDGLVRQGIVSSEKKGSMHLGTEFERLWT